MVEISGVSISGGMIYVGGRLPKASGSGDENCLINPALPVANHNPDLTGETMYYWPSYSAIQPRARHAYLQWLAGGRQSPEIGTGYVFLFFYGLERRVFIDRAEEDYASISHEVSRLLEIYGGNGSFNGYARRLLALLEVFGNRGQTRPVLRPDMKNGFELPLDVRFYLGRKLMNDEPFEPEDALLWVLALPDSYPRTPVVRCFDEFQDLWRVRFNEQWPGGLRIRRPRSELKLSYRSASGSFQGSFTAENLPDIASVQAPVARLRDLLNACSDELDAYSRCVGKQPEWRGALQAAPLLPSALAATSHAACAVRAKARVTQLMDAQAKSLVCTDDMLEALQLPASTSLQAVGPVLDFLDVGFEPDRRFGALSSADSTRLALFRAEGQVRPGDLEEFKAARTHVEIAILAAAADGQLDPAELEAVNNEIRGIHGLSSAEQSRLFAYAKALAGAIPKPQGILNRAGRLDTSKRDKLVRAAMSAILADGRVTPEEVKYLERLYKAIGLPPEAVYAALHRGVGSGDEPVSVAEARPSRGTPIPKTASPQPAGISIDLARLGAVREQTAAVSTLLSQIFVEDAPEAAPAASTTTPADQPKGGSLFAGLNSAHTQLLILVLEGKAPTWAKFEEAAQLLKLMPEGALETLNEWGFDRYDEPIIEPGEDPTPPEQLITLYREATTPA